MKGLTKYEIGRIEVLKYTIKTTTQLKTVWAAEDEISKLLEKSKK
jgi:hypothetical protein